MTRTFFGFAFSASMLPAGEVHMVKRDLDIEEVREALPGWEMCLNPFHKTTVEAARHRFGLPIQIPQTPPCIDLQVGDAVVVMQVTGLPRRTDQLEYSHDEIAQATFVFMEIRLTK